RLTARSNSEAKSVSRMSAPTKSATTPAASAALRARPSSVSLKSTPVTLYPSCARATAWRPKPHGESSTRPPGLSPVTPTIQRTARLGGRGSAHPVVVAEDGDRVIAWGSLNAFSPRDAYRHVADFSIYVVRSHRGQGVGKVLLARLVQLAREHGYHKMVLSAFPFNAAGMALYEKVGFRTVGTYKEQGLLDGRWVDTIVMEKLL